MIHIRVVSLNGQPPTQKVGCDFDESGGTIGRADTNRLVLADPERHVSRLQASVVWRDGRFELVNQGANPIEIDGRSVATGDSTEIRAGSRIDVGAYVLEVSGAASPARGAASGPAVTGDDPLGLLGDLSPHAAGSDPFADILGGANVAGGAPCAPEPSAKPAIKPPAAAPKGARPASPGIIPDDFDPFADPFAAPPPDKGAEPRSMEDLGIRSDGGAAEPGISTLFGLGAEAPGSSVDPFAGSALGEPRPGAGGGGDTLDPLAAISGTPLPDPGQASVPDQVPELRGAYKPPPVAGAGVAFRSWENEGGSGEVGNPAAADAPAEPGPAPSRAEIDVSRASPPAASGVQSAPVEPPAAAVAGAASGGASSADALTQAFLTGLGVPDLALPPNMTPAMMERVGRLLREATQGTLDLLLARAATKRELRAEVTMIVGRDNNPLKFSPSVEVALAHLLAPQGRGFLPPVAAMCDAYNDLRSHEVGHMAGLKAALSGVLARFDPAALEQRLSDKSVLDTLLPMNRRAKLWGLYTELYRDIAAEAEDDFHTLFGREFLRAYEEHVARLHERDG